MFWISYSAYARGVADEQVQRLLALVSNKCNKTWHQDDAYGLVWSSEYEQMVSHYVERITDVVDRWLETPAGLKLVQKLEKGRISHSTLPFMRAETIGEYEGCAGLPWGVHEVYQIFDILSEICETIKLENTVEVSEI